MEFGPFAAENRKRRGLGKPETFAFLGFTHICGRTSKNRFTVLRQTIRKRLQAKLQAVKTELRRRMHEPIPEVGKWLKAVVGGHIRYYGVPGNRYALAYLLTRTSWSNQTSSWVERSYRKPTGRAMNLARSGRAAVT